MADQPRQIRYVPLADVPRAERNPKDHDLELVKGLIRRFGFVDGAVHDGRTDRIIAGHGRLESLQEMEAAGEDPPEGIVVGERGWEMPLQVGWSSANDAEAETLIVGLNQSTTAGGWLDRELADVLADLQADDPTLLALTGFSEDDLAAMQQALADNEPEPDYGDVDLDDTDITPPAVVLSREGDVWLLGEHRVTCGDATDSAVVERVMAGGLADLVWTDPPYGVSYVGKTKDALTIDNDALDPAALQEFLHRLLGAALAACKPGGAWYVAAPPGPLFHAFGAVLLEFDVWRQTIAWVKNSLVMGRSDYHYRHEALFYGWKPGAAHQPPPDRRQDTVWEIDRPTRSKEHPTMKPVELVARSLRNSSNRNGLVLDVCGGSGTTLIAAEATGRRARLVELSPGYTDVICRRWQELTGRLPVLERTGQAVDFTAPGAADQPDAVAPVAS